MSSVVNKKVSLKYVVVIIYVIPNVNETNVHKKLLIVHGLVLSLSYKISIMIHAFLPVLHDFNDPAVVQICYSILQ